MTEEPLKKCIHPEGCKHPKANAKVERLIGTGAGIIFKGSGFYETDYRSKEYHEAAKKDNGAATKSTAAASSEKSSETKSENKNESKKTD
jgi:predicted nucleic acid-binding Zn ribbon protein